MIAVAGEALANLSQSELREAKRLVAGHLKDSSLKSFNLEAELLERYRSTTELYSSVLHDESVPANQKAQVMNSCANLLSQISKIQLDVYNSERIKLIERVFIDTLKALPNAEAALDLYEENCKRYLA